jgi:L-amino acid N-acyltransferase YncA
LDKGFMRIRQAESKDARAIAEVHVLAWQQAYAVLLPAGYLAALSVADREAMWADSMNRRSASLLVAEHDGHLVGFSAFGSSRAGE